MKPPPARGVVLGMTKALPLILALVACATSQGHSADRNASPQQLQKWLKQYPDADANGDGTLTMQEAQAYLQAQRGGKKAKSGDAAASAAKGGKGIVPDRRDVRYGPHERNVFDFWFAKDTSKPAPLIVFIHGGGFVGGDKSGVNAAYLKQALDGGAAFMSVNYRFRKDAPIQDILRDCARAIQHVRANASEFRIDPKRVASFGGSAGAGTSLWLATHDDLADPKSSDPVLRQSSRLSAAGMLNGQATYDLVEWEAVIYPFKPEWRNSPTEGPEFYHFKTEADLATPEAQRILADCSMLKLLSADDPPVFMFCSQPDGEPTSRGHLLHHPKHVQVVETRCKELGIPVQAVYASKAGAKGSNGSNGDPSKHDEDVIAFLLGHLRQ
jgi:acetyl esterase/lipase